MIKTICYISDSTSNVPLNMLDDIYIEAKSNNFKNNITGILIHVNKNYLQVLEGKAEKVDGTFKRIKTDSRHKNIFEVINTSIEERIFEDYNFGFTIIDNKRELSNLNDYLKWLRHADNKPANKVIYMLENFIERL
tara:strand:+ start:1647 stop:2054 length:408 start_codon:yes stop_codon:yes gene_type:complete